MQNLLNEGLLVWSCPRGLGKSWRTYKSTLQDIVFATEVLDANRDRYIGTSLSLTLGMDQSDLYFVTLL